MDGRGLVVFAAGLWTVGFFLVVVIDVWVQERRRRRLAQLPRYQFERQADGTVQVRIPPGIVATVTTPPAGER